MNVRFAAIPKCASSTLKALGLLGCVPGQQHSRITEYPDWQTFEWMVVLRDNKSWYESWYWEVCRNPDTFTQAMGFQYNSMEGDLARLAQQPKDFLLPTKLDGVHAWVPFNFAEEFPWFLEHGMGFKEYCYATITCGIRCTPLTLLDLDAWLLEHGVKPKAFGNSPIPHMNARPK